MHMFYIVCENIRYINKLYIYIYDLYIYILYDIICCMNIFHITCGDIRDG